MRDYLGRDHAPGCHFDCRLPDCGCAGDCNCSKIVPENSSVLPPDGVCFRYGQRGRPTEGTEMTKFAPGTHAATYIRTGHFSFAVHPRGFAGSHVLELVDFADQDLFVVYLDGVEVPADPELWVLAGELSVGESRFLDDRDA